MWENNEHGQYRTGAEGMDIWSAGVLSAELCGAAAAEIAADNEGLEEAGHAR